MPKPHEVFGDSMGFQRERGRPLGDRLEGFYHGSTVGDIKEIVPSSRSGWANHKASHPDKVYGAHDEVEAWSQATTASIKRLGEFYDEHLRLPDLHEMPKPTVYEATFEGNVESDPEYDKTMGDALDGLPSAVRSDGATVTRELTMPPGHQGTLFPRWVGRENTNIVSFPNAGLRAGREMLRAHHYEPLELSRPNSPAEDLDVFDSHTRRGIVESDIAFNNDMAKSVRGQGPLSEGLFGSTHFPDGYGRPAGTTARLRYAEQLVRR